MATNDPKRVGPFIPRTASPIVVMNSLHPLIDETGGTKYKSQAEERKGS